jgi:hypothetical protein
VRVERVQLENIVLHSFDAVPGQEGEMPGRPAPPTEPLQLSQAGEVLASS